MSAQLQASEALEPSTARVSVVIPCLNEAENIEACVETARRVLRENWITGEVIVVDNGSEDGSGQLARAAGAKVVLEPRRGYGNAYLAGFAAARGDYIVMIDADLTYDFEEIPRFVRELDDGGEFVMGNRMRSVDPGAMSLLSRIGNPLLSGFLNLLFRTPVRDAHCGMRAFRRSILPVLELRATGMELASEMVIRATRTSLDIRELPIALRRRGGKSKLAPFRDGWRHLRLMLLYSPNFLFLIPGILFGLIGIVLMALVFAHASLFGRTFFIHTLLAGSLLVVVGTQLFGFVLCGRAYAVNHLGHRDPWLERNVARFRLEHGLALGLVLMSAGAALGAVVVSEWIARGLGSLAHERVTILAATLIIVGIQVFFTSFLLSIIGLRRPIGLAEATKTKGRRICLVYDCLYPYTVGGAERWYRNLASRLAAEGHEVTYLTRRQWEAGAEPDIPGVRVLTVSPKMGLYVRGRRRILPPLLFGLGTFRHLLWSGRRYDVVHTASFPYFSVLAAAAARPRGGYRLVVDWHEIWSRAYWLEHLGIVRGRIGWWVQRLCLRVPQRAFCFSRLHERRLHECGLQGVTVLEGEYAGELASPSPKPAHSVVVFAGRHIPEKRVGALLPAVVRARREIPELRCVILGDGPERPGLLAAIDEQGLGEFVSAPGFVDGDEVDRAIERALCVILPSRREGYGLVVVEAAARATPVIVVESPDNAATELVDEGENGVIAASSSPEDLAAAIIRVHGAGLPLRESTAAWFVRNMRRLSLERSLETVSATYAGRGRPYVQPQPLRGPSLAAVRSDHTSAVEVEPAGVEQLMLESI
jgi:glycosyltransferase involved in cell wall biosynthesis